MSAPRHDPFGQPRNRLNNGFLDNLKNYQSVADAFFRVIFK